MQPFSEVLIQRASEVCRADYEGSVWGSGAGVQNFVEEVLGWKD